MYIYICVYGINLGETVIPIYCLVLEKIFTLLIVGYKVGQGTETRHKYERLRDRYVDTGVF